MIHHVAHEVPPDSVEECVAFYRLLGFEPVPVPRSIGDRAVWLERTGEAKTQVHLMPRREAQRPAGHFAVVCRNFEETVERLHRDRSAQERERHPVCPRARHWGSPRAFVHDPAGHLVELMAWPPDEAGPADGP